MKSFIEYVMAALLGALALILIGEYSDYRKAKETVREQAKQQPYTVHEHKTPSGKSCYLLKDGDTVIAFDCD